MTITTVLHRIYDTVKVSVNMKISWLRKVHIDLIVSSELRLQVSSPGSQTASLRDSNTQHLRLAVSGAHGPTIRTLSKSSGTLQTHRTRRQVKSTVSEQLAQLYGKESSEE